jgi:hypothetical protein
MSAVVEIVRRGRQVFYFTAQRDEVAKWQAAVAAAGGIDCKVNALPVDGPPPVVDTSLAGFASGTADLPAPGTDSLEEYAARLGVPPFPLKGGSEGEIHACYLVETAGQLHRMLLAGCRCLGQFRVVASTGGADAFVQLGVADEPGFAARTEAVATVLCRLRALYAVGRGNPVGRDDLLRQECPVSHLKYADKVVELAEGLGGDARRLVDQLRNKAIKGFQQRKVDELEAWLEAEGFLDGREPLPPSLLVARAVADCAGAISGAGLEGRVATVAAERALRRHGKFE